ncbi:hypothetical protein [Paraburkholderia sp. SIMBA_054]|uniref:hypothetical protein n=1 Tax=Paraburkholderia sp. SIMBA_054 TaxID=3085795 RepID=UPI003978795C
MNTNNTAEKSVRVNVRQIVDILSKSDDEGVAGLYAVIFNFDTTDVPASKLASIALDIFHARQGIDCLDDFRIDVIDSSGNPVEQDEAHDDYSRSASGHVEKLTDTPDELGVGGQPAGRHSVVIEVPVTAQAPATPERIRATVHRLIEVGLEAAGAAVASGGADKEAAQFAIDLNIFPPTVKAAVVAAPLATSVRTGEAVIIDKQVGGEGQRTFFRSVLSIDGSRFLINIIVDSVKEQSRATISRWSTAGWQEVYALHPAEMEVDFTMGYGRKPIRESEFEQVTSRLIRVATGVCV